MVTMMILNTFGWQQSTDIGLCAHDTQPVAPSVYETLPVALPEYGVQLVVPSHWVA